MASAVRPRPLGRPARASRAHLSATHVVRPACLADVAEIHELVERYAAEGLMLPRTPDEISVAIDSYVVVVDQNDRVKACAALYEYSPSLAEIGCVAVAPDAQGLGLGSMAVRGAEAIARRRDIGELFALTLADGFFQSLGYAETTVARYPEKLARYDQLRAGGVDVVERSCFRKLAD
jgi:amino-acid N-acetyltransferase